MSVLTWLGDWVAPGYFSVGLVAMGVHIVRNTPDPKVPATPLIMACSFLVFAAWPMAAFGWRLEHPRVQVVARRMRDRRRRAANQFRSPF